VGTAFRYEEDIAKLHIMNSTLGRDVARPFQAAASRDHGVRVRNLLMLDARPREAADRSNLIAAESWFVNANGHDYRLVAAAPAVDAGISLPQVTIDRDGVKRAVGRAPDVGAYEWVGPRPRP
jgi:hypothetical protein